MSLRQINLELGDSLIVVLSISTLLETQIKNSSRLLREPSKTFANMAVPVVELKGFCSIFPLSSPLPGKRNLLRDGDQAKRSAVKIS